MTRLISLGLMLVAIGSSSLWSQEIPSEEEIGTEDVLQSEDVALAELFPESDSARSCLVRVDSSMREALHERLGWVPRDSSIQYFDVFAGGRLVGSAVVTDEQGKYRPITFMAGVDTTLRIVDVRVLVYRESRGGEVRHTRFLKQYRGKSLDNPLRINRDIINITGATISVNALNAGVRKSLAMVEYLHSAGVRAPQ